MWLKITILSDEKIVADSFNNCFNKIVKNTYPTLANKNFPKKKTYGVNLNLLEVICQT